MFSQLNCVSKLVPAGLLALASCLPVNPQEIPVRLSEASDTARMEEARRRAAQEELRRLHEKMEHFVRAWNDFIREYSERGTFNIRKARAINQAWRKLEREESWPRN